MTAIKTLQGLLLMFVQVPGSVVLGYLLYTHVGATTPMWMLWTALQVIYVISMILNLIVWANSSKARTEGP